MEQHILEDLIAKNLSIAQLAEKLNCSKGSIRHWLRKYFLKTNNKNCKKGGRNIKCKLCGDNDLNNFYMRPGGTYQYRCKSCVNKTTANRFRSYKQQAVEYKGGKCSLCGYYRCLAALDFHHLDPTQKDPKWRAMKNWLFERVKDELDKCILVCKNCHAEIHYGL